MAKRCYIASRLIIKRFSARQLKVDECLLTTKFNTANNKLEVLKSGKMVPISCSISHSKGVVLVAISQGEFNLGVDIELNNSGRNIDAISENYFSQEDNKLIQDKGINYFYRLWTLKEAMVKCENLDLFPSISKDILSLLKNKYFLISRFQNFTYSIISDKYLKDLTLQIIDHN